MEIEGNIIKNLGQRSGTSQNGNEWTVATYLLETIESYPKKMLFEVMGKDRIDRLAIKEGKRMKVYFDINAHEYEGKYFNQIRAWDAREVQQQ